MSVVNVKFVQGSWGRRRQAAGKFKFAACHSATQSRDGGSTLRYVVRPMGSPSRRFRPCGASTGQVGATRRSSPGQIPDFTRERGGFRYRIRAIHTDHKICTVNKNNESFDSSGSFTPIPRWPMGNLKHLF